MLEQGCASAPLRRLVVLQLLLKVLHDADERLNLILKLTNLLAHPSSRMIPP